jgi:hypothetical protein
MVYRTADGFGVTYARRGGGSSNAIGRRPLGEGGASKYIVVVLGAPDPASDDRGVICGLVTAAVSRVEVELRDGAVVSADTLLSPDALVDRGMPSRSSASTRNVSLRSSWDVDHQDRRYAGLVPSSRGRKRRTPIPRAAAVRWAGECGKSGAPCSGRRRGEEPRQHSMRDAAAGHGSGHTLNSEASGRECADVCCFFEWSVRGSNP